MIELETLALVALGVLGVGLVGYLIYEACHKKKAYSKVKSTRGLVVDMDYVASRTYTTTSVGAKGQITTNVHRSPEKHHVYIYCEELKQKIHRNSERLYQMVRLDDVVEIEYQEEYSYDSRKPDELEFTDYRLISMTSPKNRKYVVDEPQEETYANGHLIPKIN